MNATYYIEINLFCIIILLLLKNQFHQKTERFSTSTIVFTRLIWAAVVLCASDAFNGIFHGANFIGAGILLQAGNVLYFEALTLIAYLWMVYVFIKLDCIVKFNRKKLALMAIPLMIFTVIIVTNPITQFVFTIDQDNVYQRNVGVNVHWLITWMYLIIPTIVAAYLNIKDKSEIKRQENTPYLYFIIAPTVAGILQMFFYGLTAIQVGVTISVVMICLAVQNNQVLTDALTGLNNRRGFDVYLKEHMKHFSDTPISFVMVDIDDFKQVNDKYGHMVGDNALEDTAGAIKAACSDISKNILACRYGGDEFVITGTNCTYEDITRLKFSIRRELQAKNERPDVLYNLAVSIGDATGICANERDVKRLLDRADETMYEEKKKVKKNMHFMR